MRLIDADAVIERIEKVIQKAIERGEITDYMEEESAYVIAWLYTEPTAYDVDKVVDELKFATKKGVLNACDSTGLLSTGKYKGSFINTQHAIDIVRRGGVDE